MAYEDKSITCQNCGNPFTFTAAQQEFLASKGLASQQPRRCPSCRELQLAAAKAAPAPVLDELDAEEAEAEEMGARARRGGRVNGVADDLESSERRDSRGRPSDLGGAEKRSPRPRERRGQSTEDAPPPARGGFGGPPRPSFNRPPLFAPAGGAPPSFPAGPPPPRQFFPAVCSQCGKQTQVPFQPRGDRPVYCMDCFRQQRAAAGR